MKIDISKTIELLNNAEDVLILTHKNPDGDTLGCGVALCRVLKSLGKRARIENNDVIPSKYDYLFEGLSMDEFEPKYIVAVDVADDKLLGSTLQEKYADKVDLCIDHHGTNVGYAKNLYVVPEDGAAALTLYRIFKQMNVEITPDVANALYTGLSTDTGCFKYSNANAEAYRVGADLIECGANNADINVAMFEMKPRAYYELLKETLAGMRIFCDGKVIVFKVTNDMFARTGATPDLCDSIAAMSRQFEGSLCGITMKEKPNGGFKFSLRTYEPLDAAKLCSNFGGGGHMRAAGCDSGEDEEETLSKLIALIEAELG